MRTRAEHLADAVLTEGYALYPYRASALKNRYRWQFGVLMPPSFLSPSEPSSMHVEMVLRGARPTVDVTLRAFHVERRQVHDATGVPVEELDVGGRRHVSWEVGHLRTNELSVDLDSSCRDDVVWEAVEEDRPVRDRGEVVGSVTSRRCEVRAELAASLYDVGDGLSRLSVSVANVVDARTVDRADAARRSPVSTHVILIARDGEFASAISPAPEVADQVADCRNDGLWPVLVGASTWATTVLAAPVILSDDPMVAPESTADLFDATEIEELLALRIATLTPSEKAAAAATDPRVAAAVERFTDEFAASPTHARLVPTATLHAPDRAATTALRVGARVRLRPGSGGDAHDRFYEGRVATVVEVRADLDGGTHLAVTLEDDPGAQLRRETGRHLHFRPDEVEPL